MMMIVHLCHLLSYLVNMTHKDNLEDKEEDHHVAQRLIDNLFSVRWEKKEIIRREGQIMI